MLSADDVSCSSSQVSAKSEKNMADFDGEESGCEEELVQINSHAELSSHLQQHLPNLASIYHEHLVQGEPLPLSAGEPCSLTGDHGPQPQVFSGSQVRPFISTSSRATTL